jgi:ABC-type taurine transport system substrate-binding protein
VTATLPTGAVMDASGDWAVGEGITWGALASGANSFVVTAAASGHTVVGSGTVATTTSASFRTVKTAADTFVTTRIG